MTHSRPLLQPLDPDVRLSDEELAARFAEEFQADSLAAHQLCAGARMPSVPGVCCNCQGECAAQAVYCDVECRADHERRLSVLARQRKSVG